MQRNGKRRRRTSTKVHGTRRHDARLELQYSTRYNAEEEKRREEKRRAISRKDEWNDYGKAERTKNEDTSRQAIRITRQTDKAKHADFIFLVSYLLLVGSFAA